MERKKVVKKYIPLKILQETVDFSSNAPFDVRHADK